MATAEKPLVELVQELPPELQAQVRSYVTQLLKGQGGRPAHPLRQPWASALRDLRVSSVELQHWATEWMAEGALKRAGDDVSH